MRPKQPKAISPQLVAQISKFVFNGFDSSDIACLCNLPESTVKDLRSGKYDSSVRKGTLLLKNKAIERIKSGKGKLGGLIWWLERRFPKEYAKAETQLSLSSGNTYNQTLVVSADVAEGLLKRSKAALTEIDQLIANKQPEAIQE